MKKILIAVSLFSLFALSVSCNRDSGQNQDASSTAPTQEQEERYPTTDSVGGETEASPSGMQGSDAGTGTGTDAGMDDASGGMNTDTSTQQQ